MTKMKNDMSNINDNIDDIELNMHEHEIEVAKRNDEVDLMSNEINYRVLEIKSLSVVFDKNTDGERTKQS